MIFLISSVVANLKLSKDGGTDGGQKWGEGTGERFSVKAEQSFAILSEKKLREDEERKELDENVGRVGEQLRERSELSADQSYEVDLCVER